MKKNLFSVLLLSLVLSACGKDNKRNSVPLPPSTSPITISSQELFADQPKVLGHIEKVEKNVSNVSAGSATDEEKAAFCDGMTDLIIEITMYELGSSSLNPSQAKYLNDLYAKNSEIKKANCP